MRGVLAPIPCLVVALALAGCMGRTTPVAMAPAPMAVAYAEPAPARFDAAYYLDTGDKLRVVVYGQEGLTNTYAIDAGGSITMPLIGSVPARGRTPAGLAAEISGSLRRGFIREPSVAVEVESYRPFFILGEVAAPARHRPPRQGRAPLQPAWSGPCSPQAPAQQPDMDSGRARLAWQEP